MQLERGQWIALTCILGIGVVAAIQSGDLSLGDVIVGGGTLALAVTAYLQVRHLDEQRTYERAARFAWKDVVLKGSPGKFALEVRMIANLSHTAAVVRFFSLHDADRRRFAHVWQTIGLKPGDVLPRKCPGLKAATSAVDRDLYDVEKPIVLPENRWLEQAAWARVILTHGGHPEQELHVWMPREPGLNTRGEAHFAHAELEYEWRNPRAGRVWNREADWRAKDVHDDSSSSG